MNKPTSEGKKNCPCRVSYVHFTKISQTRKSTTVSFLTFLQL